MTDDIDAALEGCEARIENGMATFIEVGCMLIEAEERLGIDGMYAVAVRLGIDLEMLEPLLPIIRQMIS